MSWPVLDEVPALHIYKLKGLVCPSPSLHSFVQTDISNISIYCVRYKHMVRDLPHT